MRKLRDADRHIPDAISDLLDGAGGLARARQMQATAMGFDRAMWAQLASLGWIGAAVPESQGGGGLAIRDIALMLEAAGRRLLPEPLVPAIAASTVLAKSGAAGAALLAELVAGQRLCVPVEREGAPIFDAHMAETFLVPAENAVCAVARGTPGLAVASEETVDGGSITRLSWQAVARGAFVPLLSGDAAQGALGDTRDMARLGYAALLVGLMDEALDMTVAYLRERRQFGRAIGTFQALQHRCASLYVEIASSRALLFEAAKAMGSPRQALAAAAAKAHATETSLVATRECVQLHGAMGYTHEHNISLFFRRAMTLAQAGGDAIACRKLIHVERQRLSD